VPCAQSAAGIYSSDGSFDRFACLKDGDNTQVFNGAFGFQSLEKYR
jgi:hypothetical protein